MELVDAWIHQPDYAHGFIVLPLALYFLYDRRDAFPGIRAQIGWNGVWLLLLSIGLRLAGSKFFLSSLDGWSIVGWLAGATWLLAGYRVFHWAWPALAFMLFMVPLPYRIEMSLSLPLQNLATRLSSWILQSVGEPAVAEGNTIFLVGHTLEVARACSGMRIFVTSVALGSGWAILMRRGRFDSFLVIAAAIPLAVIANSLRIVLTGLLIRHASDELSANTIHDLPGWLMIPATTAMFGLLVWYLGKLLPANRPVSPLEAKERSP